MFFFREYMISHQQKVTAFFAVHALTFVAFLFFLLQFTLSFEQEIYSLTWNSILIPIGFFLLSISGIVFAAILPSSLLFIVIPAFLAFFAGTVAFNAPLEFFLTLGLPLSLLFWSIRRNMANRIHPDFTNDIRRPLTTLFLMMLFFGSFAIAPWTLRQFSEQSDTISAWITNSTASLQEKFQSQITDSMTKTFQENLEETWNTQLESSLAVCQGNTTCEEEIRNNAAIEKEKMFTEMQNALLSSENSKKSSEVFSSILKSIAESSQEQSSKTMILFLGGMLVFALFSPLAWPLSFLTMLLFSLLFYFFKLIGVLHVTYEKVQREIIV